MAEYKNGTYYRGYFSRISNNDLSLMTCKNKIVIPSILQSYVLHWYHTYLLHPGMDRMEAMICQHLYWPDIRDAVQKEVTNCDTCQRKKLSYKKYGRLLAKLAEEILWNILCVYLIGTYIIRAKGKKENLHLKNVTMIDPVTEWFEVVRYDDKIVITISNLVETMWLSRYPRPI